MFKIFIICDEELEKANSVFDDFATAVQQKAFVGDGGKGVYKEGEFNEVLPKSVSPGFS